MQKYPDDAHLEAEPWRHCGRVSWGDSLVMMCDNRDYDAIRAGRYPRSRVECALEYCAKWSLLEPMRLLVELGAVPPRTVLHEACCKSRSVETVRYCLEQLGLTPGAEELRCAAHNRASAVVDHLTEIGCPPDSLCLEAACLRGYPRLVRYCLDAGVAMTPPCLENVFSGQFSIEVASMLWDEETLKKLAKSKRKGPAMVKGAASRPNSTKQELKRVLSLGPWIGDQEHALSEACRFGNCSVARLLVAAGVPVDNENVVFGMFVGKYPAVLELLVPLLSTEKYIVRNMHYLFPHDYSYYYDRHPEPQFARLYAEQEQRLPRLLSFLIGRFPDLVRRRVTESHGRIRGVGETLLEMACDAKSPLLVTFLLGKGASITPNCLALVASPPRVPNMIQDLEERILSCEALIASGQ